MQTQPPLPRWWMLALAALVVGATWGAAASDRLVGGEPAVFESVNGLAGGLLWPVRVVMVFGTTTGALATAALAAVLMRRRLLVRALVASLAASVVTARLLAEALKRVVGRGRPGAFSAQLHHLLVRDHTGGHGYPSAHAAISMALALTLSWWWPKARWPLVIVAVLVALGRLYVGVHLPLDAAGGIACGVLASAVGAGTGRALTRGTTPSDQPAPVE